MGAFGEITGKQFTAAIPHGYGKTAGAGTILHRRLSWAADTDK
jgi:hypothetical protein